MNCIELEQLKKQLTAEHNRRVAAEKHIEYLKKPPDTLAELLEQTDAYDNWQQSIKDYNAIDKTVKGEGE